MCPHRCGACEKHDQSHISFCSIKNTPGFLRMQCTTESDVLVTLKLPLITERACSTATMRFLFVRLVLAVAVLSVQVFGQVGRHVLAPTPTSEVRTYVTRDTHCMVQQAVTASHACMHALSAWRQLECMALHACASVRTRVTTSLITTRLLERAIFCELGALH